MKDHKYDIFGFKAMPFAASPESPYLDPPRKRTLHYLQDFIERRGFAVLCGAPGTGKTILLNHICAHLPSNETRIVYIPFSMLKPPDMLRNICGKLDLETSMSSSRMLGKIQDRISEIQPVNPVLVLDEIQKISHETLEIIRLMTNFSFEDKNVFSVIMAGNDEFLQQLKLRINEPTCQRITCFQRLKPISREETKKYVSHHFEAAGAHQEILDPEAANLVFDITSGIPRKINSLMCAAINAAADEQLPLINIDHVNSANELVSIPKQEIAQ